jgi:hypothetical protein
MAELLSILLGIAFLVVLVPYVLGPLLIFFTLRFRCPPKVVPVDPRVHALPDQARHYLGEAYEQLAAEGFELLGTTLLPDLMPNVQTLFALYINRASSDMAMSAIIVAQGGIAGELKTSYVEFLRRFDDGVVVQTNNSRELSSFKPVPGEFTTKFWEIRDIRRLYHVHQALAVRFRQRGQPVDEFDATYQGDILQYVARGVLERSFRDQLETGYLAEDANGFRPTMKGAMIMTWKELWPIKAIRRWLEKRNAERLLAEIRG